MQLSQEELELVCKKYQVASLAVFGSVLRDDFRPDSDVDVLVTFLPEAQVTFMTLGRMKRELEGIFGLPVDLVLKEGLKQAIRDEVISNSHKIYPI